jgi:cbb3-type cytochrome oxidase maturation protein
MSVIVVLIGASLLVALGFLIAYLWAVKSGQYDDKYTPSVRILFDESKKNTEFRSQNAEFKNKSDDDA